MEERLIKFLGGGVGDAGMIKKISCGLIAVAAVAAAYGQTPVTCKACPEKLTVTKEQWSCLVPKLAKLRGGTIDPIFVPLSAGPCDPSAATAVVAVPASASAYLTKRQLTCLAAKAAELGEKPSITVTFAECP